MKKLAISVVILLVLAIVGAAQASIIILPGYHSRFIMLTLDSRARERANIEKEFQGKLAAAVESRDDTIADLDNQRLTVQERQDKADQAQADYLADRAAAFQWRDDQLAGLYPTLNSTLYPDLTEIVIGDGPCYPVVIDGDDIWIELPWIGYSGSCWGGWRYGEHHRFNDFRSRLQVERRNRDQAWRGYGGRNIPQGLKGRTFPPGRGPNSGVRSNGGHGSGNIGTGRGHTDSGYIPHGGHGSGDPGHHGNSSGGTSHGGHDGNTNGSGHGPSSSGGTGHHGTDGSGGHGSGSSSGGHSSGGGSGVHSGSGGGSHSGGDHGTKGDKGGHDKGDKDKDKGKGKGK